MTAETITISQDEYDELLADAEFLRCLEAAGVDNWEGYDDALQLYDEPGDDPYDV